MAAPGRPVWMSTLVGSFGFVFVNDLSGQKGHGDFSEVLRFILSTELPPCGPSSPLPAIPLDGVSAGIRSRAKASLPVGGSVCKYGAERCCLNTIFATLVKLRQA